MFEQTFLNTPQTARKPYSMGLSLILQILAIGVLCLVPLVFTSVLPSLQLKGVLAAPPKPLAALKNIAAVPHSPSAAPRVFHFADMLLRPKAAVAGTSIHELAAPSIEGSQMENGDVGGIIGSVIGTAPPPPPAPVVKQSAPKAIRIGTIAAANLIRKVQPTYPPLARASRVQGTVEFTATISKEGTIENLTLLRGHPLLINAARDAVLQWRYRPTLLNGEPVEVITDIVVNFTLSQ